MVVDTSVVISILKGEPESASFFTAIIAAETVLIGAPNLLEASMVFVSRTDGDLRDVDALCSDLGVRVVPFDPDEYRHAAAAFRRYGKGRHPARLNFGDCMAYAASKSTGEALLFKGADFAKTDVERHPASAAK